MKFPGWVCPLPRYEITGATRLIPNLNVALLAAHARGTCRGILSISTVLIVVDENRCPKYIRNVRLTAAHVFDQLVPEHAAPILTRENVNWRGGVEVPQKNTAGLPAQKFLVLPIGQEPYDIGSASSSTPYFSCDSHKLNFCGVRW